MVFCNEDCIARYHKASAAAEGKGECELANSFMLMSEELCDFPFSFTTVTTSQDFGLKKLTAYLEERQLLGVGLWHGIPNLTEGEVYGDSLVRSMCGSTAALEEVLSSSLPRAAQPTPPSDWSQYYSWRGLEASCPAAVLLHVPMTVYYIVTLLWPDMNSVPQDLVIHALGVEYEVDLIPLFQELQHLLSVCRSVSLTLIGRSVSASRDGHVTRHGQVTCCVRRGSYHKLGLPSPHLAIGLNAGLAAYQSWKKTLERLKRLQIPSFFTDLCLLSIGMSEASVAATGAHLGPPLVNPFRSPFRCTSSNHRLPRFSNAFISRLT